MAVGWEEGCEAAGPTDEVGEVGRGPAWTRMLRKKAAVGHSRGPYGQGTRSKGRLGMAQARAGEEKAGTMGTARRDRPNRPLKGRLNMSGSGWGLPHL